MLKEKVEKVIEEKIKPYLLAEGGDIQLLQVGEDGIVKVSLKGLCATCPMAIFTLKGFVEKVLKKEIAEVKEVITEEDTGEEPPKDIG